MPARASAPSSRSAPAKVATGIGGVDAITHGGFPRGRATVLLGGPGAGKTLMAMQTLVAGARSGEPGIFVAFEEDPHRLRSNVAPFGWNLAGLEQRRALCFIDARPSTELVRSGDFDLIGLLAGVERKVRALKAKRVVLDSLDMLLALLPDPLAARRELLRLHDWLLKHGLTTLITAKVGDTAVEMPGTGGAGFMQFMVDCAVALEHRVEHGVAQRSLRILKYRGSAFAENDAPFVISANGFQVASLRTDDLQTASTERVSSGVDRLDAMLGGGYYRGANILITGSPGTAKTTLAGAFAEAACRRGENTVFVSFDSGVGEIVRNLDSVRIRLRRFARDGSLHLVALSNAEGNAEAHFLQIRSLVAEHRARCLVLDPISAVDRLNSGTGGIGVSGVVERLTRWSKQAGLTLLCTSLTSSPAPEIESTSLQISTIADTWIHLSYRVHAGERNRALTVIKSRGTSHSNQVRELLLSDGGVSLTDVFTAGGEVLMGTLRWEREEAARVAERLHAAEIERRRVALTREQGDLRARLSALEQEITAKRAELQEVEAEAVSSAAADQRRRKDTARRRHADAANGVRRGRRA